MKKLILFVYLCFVSMDRSPCVKFGYDIYVYVKENIYTSLSLSRNKSLYCMM